MPVALSGIEIVRAWTDGIAVPDASHELQPVVGLISHANAWRSDGVDRPADGDVVGADGRPAECRVDEVSAAICKKEFGVSCDLSELDGQTVLEKLLFKPQFE